MRRSIHSPPHGRVKSPASMWRSAAPIMKWACGSIGMTRRTAIRYGIWRSACIAVSPQQKMEAAALYDRLFADETEAQPWPASPRRISCSAFARLRGSRMRASVAAPAFDVPVRLALLDDRRRALHAADQAFQVLSEVGNLRPAGIWSATATPDDAASSRPRGALLPGCGAGLAAAGDPNAHQNSDMPRWPGWRHSAPRRHAHRSRPRCRERSSRRPAPWWTDAV